ncbi:CLUMA_CG011732, isoform A [Clunio marinus]|uniref:CLUMA_CG011732, isoform A n=1 Tax=Clunio marinus TaxID=568069 RepID=A0A1J1IDN5_9DIPT|nr:CLUMA_CG011732, isoform A [Clunio marinus]
MPRENNEKRRKKRKSARKLFTQTNNQEENNINLNHIHFDISTTTTSKTPYKQKLRQDLKFIITSTTRQCRGNKGCKFEGWISSHTEWNKKENLISISYVVRVFEKQISKQAGKNYSQISSNQQFEVIGMENYFGRLHKT